MTYFKDLTLRLLANGEEALAPILNVGWLSKSETITTGESSIEFQEKLYRFCLDENVVVIMRGFQACEFCGLSSTEWAGKHPSYGNNSKWMSIGDGEIRVIGKDVIYAAPALIYHYVIEHQYLPPHEFIDAVVMGPQPGSHEHDALLKIYRRE